jgi:hypothetical protein
MPSVAENCVMFKTQLLEYYWALKDTEHLTADYQVTIWSEPPIVS